MLAMKSKILPWSFNVLLGCHFFKTTVFCSRVDNRNLLNATTSIKHGHAAVTLAYTLYEPPEKQNTETSPILILHGILGSRNNWNSLSKVIAQRTKRQVYSLDARNHGESPHSNEFTYSHMAADTVEFMQKMKIKKATLIGHSMGGRTSMLLALLHPELVQSLVIVDISPRGISPGFDMVPKYIKEMMDIQLTGSTMNQVRKHAGEQLSKTVQKPAILGFLLTNLAEDPPKNFKWKINLKTIYKNIDHIGQFDCDFGNVYKGPTLFIGGGDSDYIGENNHAVINKLFPKSKVVYIPGAGHWVHAEKSKEFLSLTCDFINDSS